MPNGVAFKIVYIRDGRVAIVNRRNLKPFYEQDERQHSSNVVCAPRFPLARVAVE